MIFNYPSHVAMNQLVDIKLCTWKIQKQKAKEKTVVDGQTGHGNGGTVANGEKVSSPFV